jgi:tellurite methyltransferase
MERAIVGFHPDEVGDWVAELACGHNQHVRHRPPFQVREWVVDADSREARLGTPLSCPLCDQAELPPTARLVGTSTWSETTTPAGLREAHRLPDGTWGRIMVRTGALRFQAATTPEINATLEAGAEQAIPPGVDHLIDTDGPVMFSLELHTVDRGGPAATTFEAGLEEGGDPACWAARICPECGAVSGDGPGHRAGCRAGRPAQHS